MTQLIYLNREIRKCRELLEKEDLKNIEENSVIVYLDSLLKLKEEVEDGKKT